ncbi:MAG: hypothetical protein HC850_12890 [Rhodomicrobium sp.]|nr:hypothetical protein [Rhodomicrobium sp.]
MDREANSFGERLRWKIECSDALKHRTVPPFLVQPLVENAIRHGVECADRTVTVSVDIREIDGGLRVIVEDDGDGCAADSIKSAGVGLANLRERLSLLSGRPLEIRTSPGRGFSATFAIP